MKKDEYKIISLAIEVFIKSENGVQLATYAGETYDELLAAVKQNERDGMLKILREPERGYLVEYKDVPGVQVFASEKALEEKRNE